MGTHTGIQKPSLAPPLTATSPTPPTLGSAQTAGQNVLRYRRSSATPTGRQAGGHGVEDGETDQ